MNISHSSVSWLDSAGQRPLEARMKSPSRRLGLEPSERLLHLTVSCLGWLGSGGWKWSGIFIHAASPHDAVGHSVAVSGYQDVRYRCTWWHASPKSETCNQQRLKLLTFCRLRFGSSKASFITFSACCWWLRHFHLPRFEGGRIRLHSSMGEYRRIFSHL